MKGTEEAQPQPIHVCIRTTLPCGTEFTEVVWRRRRDMMMKGIEEGRTTVANPSSPTHNSRVYVCFEFPYVFGEEEEI
jgi:hypothetical protein